MRKKWVLVIATVFVSTYISACGETISLNAVTPEVPGTGGTNSMMLSWIPPDLNTDDSTISGELIGYRIYYGTMSGIYFKVLTINNPFINQAVINNLGSGDYYFVVTAFNIYGNESEYSNEVHSTFD